MGNRFTQNQKETIKAHFANEPYYGLCKTIHSVFLDDTVSLNMKAEDLFAEAVFHLDYYLINPEQSWSKLDDLWNDAFTEYREYDSNVNTSDTTAEVTMLFYALMMPLCIAPYAEFRKMARLLHGSLRKKNAEGCRRIEGRLMDECAKHNEAVASWMKDYLESATSLSALLSAALGRKKPTKKTIAKKVEVFPTLHYICNNATKNNRIQTVMQLMVAWEMIREPDNVDDFFALFDGSTNKRLNIEWCANTTLLYVLLQELLERDFIVKTTKASAKAVARNVLKGSNPSGDRSRLCEADFEKISIIIYALDPKMPPLKLYRENNDDPLSDYDIAFCAEQLAKEGYLSITKDLNRKIQ